MQFGEFNLFLLMLALSLTQVVTGYHHRLLSFHTTIELEVPIRR